jgi:hypothetical protein
MDPMRRTLKKFKMSIITVLKTFSSHRFNRELVVFSPNQESRQFYSRTFAIQHQLRRTNRQKNPALSQLYENVRSAADFQAPRFVEHLRNFRATIEQSKP